MGVFDRLEAKTKVVGAKPQSRQEAVSTIEAEPMYEEELKEQRRPEYIEPRQSGRQVCREPQRYREQPRNYTESSYMSDEGYREEPSNYREPRYSNEVAATVMSEPRTGREFVGQDDYGNKIYRDIASGRIVTVPVVENMTTNIARQNNVYGGYPQAYNPNQVAIINSKENPKEYLIERLHLNPTEEIDVYIDPALDAEPLDFSVQDNGTISTRLEQLEKSTGLSVIPFKLAGLHSKINSIMGYDIFQIDGEYYASSNTHISSMNTVGSYEKKWIEILKSGNSVNESLLVKKDIGGEFGEIETVALNIKEIKHLMGRFRNYNPRPYSTPEDVVFTIGV